MLSRDKRSELIADRIEGDKSQRVGYVCTDDERIKGQPEYERGSQSHRRVKPHKRRKPDKNTDGTGHRHLSRRAVQMQYFNDFVP